MADFPSTIVVSSKYVAYVAQARESFLVQSYDEHEQGGINNNTFGDGFFIDHSDSPDYEHEMMVECHTDTEEMTDSEAEAEESSSSESPDDIMEQWPKKKEPEGFTVNGNGRLESLRRRREQLVESYRSNFPKSLHNSGERSTTTSFNDRERTPHQHQRDICVASSSASAEAEGSPVQLLQRSSEVSRRRRVRFSSIEVRPYMRILGDNPSCREGPSLSIAWDHDESYTIFMPLEEFERSRRRKSKKNLVLGSKEREWILNQLGYTKSEISQNARLMKETQNQRKETANNLEVQGVEEEIEYQREEIQRLALFSKSKKVDKENEQSGECLLAIRSNIQSAERQLKSNTKQSERHVSRIKCMLCRGIGVIE